jgi:hypothetical protein
MCRQVHFRPNKYSYGETYCHWSSPLQARTMPSADTCGCLGIEHEKYRKTPFSSNLSRYLRQVPDCLVRNLEAQVDASVQISVFDLNDAVRHRTMSMV